MGWQEAGNGPLAPSQPMGCSSSSTCQHFTVHHTWPGPTFIRLCKKVKPTELPESEVIQLAEVVQMAKQHFFEINLFQVDVACFQHQLIAILNSWVAKYVASAHWTFM